LYYLEIFSSTANQFDLTAVEVEYYYG